MSQHDNSCAMLKLAVRQRVAAALPPGARVLEAFAGEGRMYRGAWASFRGACIDKDRRKAEAAARERPDWAVYCGDTERALAAGWMGHVAFDVVDLDPYGGPWPFVRALLTSRRAWAASTVLIMTDGYLKEVPMASPCKALWGETASRMSGVSIKHYVETARARMREWGSGAGLRVVGWDLHRRQGSRVKSMAQHVLRLER